MKLLDDSALERSSIVANSRMNRERGAVGVNSYEKDLGLDPIAFLSETLDSAGTASWLDLCCGRGRALIDAAIAFRDRDQAKLVTLHGVDLVDMFDKKPAGVAALQLEAASLHQWNTDKQYDLITCVHGLHYVGDKLAMIQRGVSCLSNKGSYLANLDLTNLRSEDGRSLKRQITQRFRECGFDYDSRRHVLSCVGVKTLSLGYAYLGADDTAGPNYSGQEAVHSYYTIAE